MHFIMLAAVFKKIRPKTTFGRNIATLMTGTSIAQAIPIAISPILTRLYTPEEFGIFALYMAIASVVSVLVTGRYELAIVLPKRDAEAVNILALSVILSCVVSAILLLVVVMFNNQITKLLDAPEISKWLYFVPITTLLSGVYQSLNYWSNRKSQYKRMALSRMLQNGGASAAQLLGGTLKAGATGLVGGQLFGQALSTLSLAHLIYQEDAASTRLIKRRRISLMARRYSRFPKYLILAHGFNTAALQMPVIFLTAFFSSAVAGFYTLTQRVFGAPMSLVAGAIGDVFRQEASHMYAHDGSCRVAYEKTFKRLFLISVLPFTLFFFAAPQFFAWIFGAGWESSGEFAQILAPMFFLRFVTSPLSVMFLIAQRQKLDLIWQTLLFLLIGLALYAGYLKGDVRISLVSFSVAYSFMYLVNGIISYRLSFGRKG